MADTDPSLTPEKRLLKLIEDPQSSKGAGGTAKTMSGVSGLRSLFSWAALRERLGEMGGPWKILFGGGKKNLGLREINAVVVIVTVGMSIFFAADILYEMKIASKNLFDELKLPKVKSPGEVNLPEERVLESISLDSLESRNIFLPFNKKQEAPVEKKGGTTQRLTELIKNLKLTGISYDRMEPGKAFCMIEDVEKSITSFLRVGDQISNMKIAAISEDTVTLELEGETIDLH